jgi:drug/metabolite transporter (DMT)-like permease
MNTESKKLATVLGIAALLIWNTMFGFLRSVTEQLGPMRASAAIYVLSGVAGCAVWALRSRSLNLPGQFSPRYLLVCGLPFVGYMITFQLAIGWAVSRQQTVEVTLINYLWPLLTMLFMVPLLLYRARWTLGPGIALGVAGVLLTVSSRADFSWAAVIDNIHTSTLPYILALCSAVFWGIYSNLTRKYAAEAKTSAVGLFMLISGIIFTCMYFFAGGRTESNAATQPGSHLCLWCEFLYVSLGPCLLAYVLWDLTMKRGNIVLVTSISYLSPLISTVVTALYLHVQLSKQLWASCIIIILGALICRYSVSENSSQSLAPKRHDLRPQSQPVQP